MMVAKTMRERSSSWSFLVVPVLKLGSAKTSMKGMRKSSLARTEGTSWYILKISPSSSPKDSTMYW